MKMWENQVQVPAPVTSQVFYTKGMSILPIGLVDSDRSSGARFITSSLDTINRPLSAFPSIPVLHRHERRRQSRLGSSSSRLTAVKTLRFLVICGIDCLQQTPIVKVHDEKTCKMKVSYQLIKTTCSSLVL
ncbi:hypothetical protein UY3_08650 [Chelonia mydas]|uniref:Uncharacterized protein n=1 Tax=Chelonia mydas TaxID=8469 RepID=M7C1C3_CHEMY|nr:hypothetical protein UY3_08650 [Chelonia mydas]